MVGFLPTIDSYYLRITCAYRPCGFRTSVSKDVEVPFNDYTCLVGPNGAGKSTILCALNVFFRQAENSTVDGSFLVEEDFHKKLIDEPVRITVTFTDLEPDAQADFADYYRQGKLVITAEARFDKGTGRAEVMQYGQRSGMITLKQFFGALDEGKKVAELKAIYEGIRKLYPELPAPGTKDAMAEALRKYEAGHPELCVLIPSSDQFYGFSKGSNRLAKYIQWVYVPAVKDATTEQVEARNSALGRLLARTVRLKTKFDDRLKEIKNQAQGSYGVLLQENQSTLDEISQSLATRLTEWAHPNASLRLEWRSDPDRAVQVQDPFAKIIAGEDGFEGELSRFGHGLQRSYLLVLLQELASTSGEPAPRLILACEEPELYQHPPQIKHLAQVLRKLSTVNSQIVVCTHSPYFVSGEGFEDVRMIRKDAAEKQTTVFCLNFASLLAQWKQVSGQEPKKPEGVLAKIHQELQPQLNEMFFTPRLVLVEGLEDVAYITTYLNLLGKAEEYHRSACHIVPTGGKSHMVPALLVAQRMGIPTFIVFDSDADKPDHNGSQKQHIRDNTALLTLSGIAVPDPLPKTTQWGMDRVVWPSDIGAVVGDEIGNEDWIKYNNRADAEYGNAGGLKKNGLHIAAALTYAWDDNKRSASLEQLCNEILSFGKPQKPAGTQAALGGPTAKDSEVESVLVGAN